VAVNVITNLKHNNTWWLNVQHYVFTSARARTRHWWRSRDFEPFHAEKLSWRYTEDIIHSNFIHTPDVDSWSSNVYITDRILLTSSDLVTFVAAFRGHPVHGCSILSFFLSFFSSFLPCFLFHFATEILLASRSAWNFNYNVQNSFKSRFSIFAHLTYGQ